MHSIVGLGESEIGGNEVDDGGLGGGSLNVEMSISHPQQVPEVVYQPHHSISFCTSAGSIQAPYKRIK